jgi:hypothetical protein
MWCLQRTDHVLCYPGRSAAGSYIYTMISSVWIFPFQEYNVRANATTDKSFSIGRFVTGLPPFSKKKNAENKWSLHKEGLQGRQLTDKMLVLTFGSSFITIWFSIFFLYKIGTDSYCSLLEPNVTNFCAMSWIFFRSICFEPILKVV